jgi:hypothetical protein
MIHGPQLLELAAVLDAERRSTARRAPAHRTPGPMRRVVGRALIDLGGRVEGTRRRGMAAGGNLA